MRLKVGFGATLVGALCVGALICWFAEPVPHDQSSSASIMERAAQEQVRQAVRESAAESRFGKEQQAGLTGQALYDEAIAISKLLRDPSAANYTLFDSESALAGELKARIYEMLRKGATREDIFDFMVARYGEMIRYQPDFNAKTALLWAAPWLTLLVGAALVVMRWRKSRAQSNSTKERT